jgi:hypothetical protein
MNWDVRVEVILKLDIGTASGWLQRLVRPFGVSYFHPIHR